MGNTNDEQVTKVAFTWLDPNNEIAKSEFLDTSGGSAQSVFSPDKVGEWTVRADFSDGTILIKRINVPFSVVPESPIGIVALMGSSLAALGGFALLRK